VASFLISIRSIFNEPNLASMANIEAGKIFSENYPLYKELAM
jgi:ubiquitin-protein ligase